MKLKLRILLLAVFCATSTPQMQAWSLASAWRSVHAFFSNDSDSTGLSVAKYSLVAGAIIGSYYLIKKFFYNNDNESKLIARQQKSKLGQKSGAPKAESKSVSLAASAQPTPSAMPVQAAAVEPQASAVVADHTKSKVEAVDVKTANEITLSAFSQSCGQYPERATQYSPSAVTQNEFERVLADYKKLMKEQLEQPALWINPAQAPQGDFKPFVQKLVLPENSKVAMWGDLHGSVHSLLRSLTRLKDGGYINDAFKIIKPNFYMFFLGDYVDRGKYGIEVIYTLLRLKLANPDKVFLVRGNHEDMEICTTYGFSNELAAKFNYGAYINPVYAIYETMPLAIFLGKPNSIEYIQCCHGGIEPGFDPKSLLASTGNNRYEWLSQLNRKDWIEKLPEDIKESIESAQLSGKENFIPECPNSQSNGSIGFMWNDFIVDEGQAIVCPERNKQVWAFGKRLTQAYNTDVWLKNSRYKIRTIIRAHQHNGEMLKKLIENKGVHHLWDGLVFTLLSAPAMGLERAAGYDFAYDSFVIVDVQDQWQLRQYSTPMIDKNVFDH